MSGFGAGKWSTPWLTPRTPARCSHQRPSVSLELLPPPPGWASGICMERAGDGHESWVRVLSLPLIGHAT